jgi:hypothetical protein
MHRYESNAQPLGRIQLGAIIVAVIGIVFGVFGAVADLDRFFQSYLVAFTFCLELSLGCLGFLLIANVVHGAWGLAVGRILAAGARTVPLMLVLFMPVLLGMDRLFLWYSRPEEMYFQTPYLRPTFFFVRVAIYFVVWIGLAYWVSAWMYQQDRASDPNKVTDRLRALSALGLILFVLSSGFSAFDWSLSLSPNYFSSVYGWLATSRQGLAAIALTIVMTALLFKPAALSKHFKRPVFGDLGSLLTALVLIVAYMEFVQGLIAWYGNFPWEVGWFLPRITGAWQPVVLLLAALHFAAPFALLIMPGFKRSVGRVVAVALLLLVMRWVSLNWVIMPNFTPDSALPHWMDAALWLGMGGIWLLLFTWMLKSQPLLPLRHPRMPVVQETEAASSAYGAAGAAD